MLTQRADQLKPGDTFTSNDGVDWHTVSIVYVLDEVGSDVVVLVATEDRKKIWLWSSEEITVQI